MESETIHQAEAAGNFQDSQSGAQEDTSRAAVARSERNVTEWMSYLPQDCVESMIRLGWDLTT
jgi:hypothetical protein